MNDDYQLNIKLLLDRGPRVQPNSEIVTLNKNGSFHRMTYSKLISKAANLANSLSKFGIKPGDSVGSFMYNNVRHLMLFYAIPCMGAVLHPLNIRLHASKLSYLIKHSNDKIIIIDEKLYDLFCQIPIEDLTNVKLIIVCSSDQSKETCYQSMHQFCNYFGKARVVDFETFVNINNNNNNHKGDEFIWPRLNDKSGMILSYTSGTTGNPKGVLHSHRSVYIHTLVAMGTDIFSLSGQDCVLPFVNFYHSLQWSFPFTSLTLGYKVLLHNDLSLTNPNTMNIILNAMINEKCTLIAGVPTVMIEIKKMIDQRLVTNTTTTNNNESELVNYLTNVLSRALVSGSAPASSLVNYFWGKWHIEMMQAWGMTEINPSSISRRISTRHDLTLSENELNNNVLNCGLMMPGIEAKIADLNDNNNNSDNDRVLANGEKGDLLVNGPFVTGKYYKSDSIGSSDNFSNKWLITGDIASFNKYCQLSILDRSKDIIKTGGETISSIEMENHVMSLEFVDKACVVAVEHPKWGERPVVVLTLLQLNNKNDKFSRNSNINDENIKKLVIDDLKKYYSKFELADDVLIWDKLPLTGTGKLSKKTVRQILKDEKYILPSLRQSKL